MLALQIGTHINEVGGAYKVFLPSTMTKNHNDLEFATPTELNSWISRYIDHYRKILLAGPFGSKLGFMEHINHLWLARSGRQFPVASFEDMIGNRTTEKFGVRLTPHGFRHCAASSIAESDTENFHIIRIILGHETLRTAERHYIHAKAQQSARLVQKNLIKIRKTLAAARQPVGRRRRSRVDPSPDSSAVNASTGD